MFALYDSVNLSATLCFKSVDLCNNFSNGIFFCLILIFICGLSIFNSLPSFEEGSLKFGIKSEGNYEFEI